ncbi:MAG: hypothetical protein IKJ73_03810 [Lachnospiraceae bacterium]|nr:hypothetical protein [Lachnospiraceae bacterium]
MLSYYIVDIGYAVNMFFILTVLLSYKRGRKTLPLAFVLGLCIYVILDFICFTEIPGFSMQFSFVLAGYFEMFSTFGMLCLFTKGNIWRNYTFLILAFVLINAVTSFLVALDAGIEEIFASYLVNGYVPVYAAVVFAIILAISGIIVCLVMSKILKKEYNGNGKIYMIFSLAYALLGIAQVVFKTSTVQESFKEDTVSNVPKVIFVVIGVTTFYVFGLLYYRYEGKRLANENKKLTEYIHDNHERYKKLVEDNTKMTAVKTEFLDYSKDVEDKHNHTYKEEIQSLAKEIDHITLTGNIVIDALIKNSYEQAKKEGVSYEVIPGNVIFSKEKVFNFATIVENILLVANDFAQDTIDKWLYLSFRQNGDMILIKAEFSKNKKSKLSIDGNIFAKMTANMQRLKLIKSVSETMYGTTRIVNEDEEGSISVLINNA